LEERIFSISLLLISAEIADAEVINRHHRYQGMPMYRSSSRAEACVALLCEVEEIRVQTPFCRLEK